MPRKTENTGFVCLNCNKNVSEITKGTIRNHCPFCLFSAHLDIIPGDRASNCQGSMHPISVISHSKKGWQIIHKCHTCGHEQPNKTADDDCINAITSIAKASSKNPLS